MTTARTRTMRSVQVPEPGSKLSLIERGIPDVGAGEVRVRVHSCGICHSDSYALQGLPGATYPLIPGHEITGVVDALGADVTDVEPGAEVGIGWFGGRCGSCPSCRRGDFVLCARMRPIGLMRDGGYADYVVVPADAVVRIPSGMALTDAAPLMCAGVTAFNALRSGGVQAGIRVAVIGIGGLGHLAIQFANKMGCEVIAVSRGSAKKELARDLGAHHFIDAQTDAAEAELADLGDADLIVATAPSGGAVTRFIPCVAPRGRVVVAGFSDDELRISPLLLISRGISVSGIPAGTPKDAEETLAFCALTGVRPQVERVTLAEVDSALERTLEGRTRFRAVLVLDGPEPAGPEPYSRDFDAPDFDARHDVITDPPSLSDIEPAVRTRGHRKDTTDEILDCPPEHLPDGQDLIEAAMRWHFSPETGSRFWLERAGRLGFDPRDDVHTLADLRRFPNIVDDLREVRIEDLIPRGYGPDARLLGVYESGGTTGVPKRVILLQDWLDRWQAWALRISDLHGHPRGANCLLLAPTGPHMMGHLGALNARMLGGTAFTVDMDPRWVRKLVNGNRADEAEHYIDHLVTQAEWILNTQHIGVLVATPPMLERLARSDRLVQLIRDSVQLISWGGTHMDADSRNLFRTEIFPGIGLRGLYGNTMALGGAGERPAADDVDACVFDPYSPYISFTVVDPLTGEEVPYGRRGRVIMHHISKSMFIPNNADRDLATRIAPPPGQFGDSIADVGTDLTTADDEFEPGVY